MPKLSINFCLSRSREIWYQSTHLVSTRWPTDHMARWPKHAVKHFFQTTLFLDVFPNFFNIYNIKSKLTFHQPPLHEHIFHMSVVTLNTAVFKGFLFSSNNIKVLLLLRTYAFTWSQTRFYRLSYSVQIINTKQTSFLSNLHIFNKMYICFIFSNFVSSKQAHCHNTMFLYYFTIHLFHCFEKTY